MAEYTVTGRVVDLANGWHKVVEGHWHISFLPPRTILLGKTSWRDPQFKIRENFADNPLIFKVTYMIRKGHYFKFKEILGRQNGINKNR